MNSCLKTNKQRKTYSSYIIEPITCSDFKMNHDSLHFLELCWCLYSSYNSLDSCEDTCILQPITTVSTMKTYLKQQKNNISKLSPHKINKPQLTDSNAFRVQVIFEKPKHCKINFNSVYANTPLALVPPHSLTSKLDPVRCLQLSYCK